MPGLVIKEFKKNDVDAMVIFGGTFTLGFPIAEVVRNTDLPMLVWAFEENRLNRRRNTGRFTDRAYAGRNYYEEYGKEA